MAEVETHEGGCLCGAVRFEITGHLRDVTYCHCGQCRKTTGHYFAATACENDELEFVADGGLKWFRASDTASRGFCDQCGSTLFWKPDEGTYTAILAGSLDLPTGLKATSHIFVKDKADYYEITDGLPQFEGDN
ncbi:GFA family protein [Curvivirga sp.]|uniref:GFA family protein n=1 Tax=Curvivirga sp. TaxID=2856848 RepID=UPI003B5B70C8